MGYLSTRRRMFEAGRSRVVFLVVAACAFVATELGRYVYRPYVRRHGIEDLGLADSVGNLGGIVVQIFLGVAILNSTRAQSYRMAVFFSAGYVLYELSQPYLPKGVFDWRDVWATAAGGALSMLLLFILWRGVEGAGNTGSSG